MGWLEPQKEGASCESGPRGGPTWCCCHRAGETTCSEVQILMNNFWPDVSMALTTKLHATSGLSACLSPRRPSYMMKWALAMVTIFEGLTKDTGASSDLTLALG